MPFSQYLPFANGYLSPQERHRLSFVSGDEKFCPAIDCRHFSELCDLFGRHEQGRPDMCSKRFGKILSAEKPLSFAHVSDKIATIDQNAGAFAKVGLDLDTVDEKVNILKRKFGVCGDAQIIRVNGRYYFKIQFYALSQFQDFLNAGNRAEVGEICGSDIKKRVSVKGNTLLTISVIYTLTDFDNSINYGLGVGEAAGVGAGVGSGGMSAAENLGNNWSRIASA